MRPFEVTKIGATKSIRNPDGRQMRRFEREFEAAVVKALDRLRRDLVRGVTDGNVHELTARLNDEAITRPLQDAIVRELQAVALAGAEFGREQVEGDVYRGYDLGTGKALDVGMWELANNAAAQWALGYAYDLVRGIIATTRDRIAMEVAEYVRNSETIGTLIQRLSSGNLFSPVRAQVIAVTEVTRAFAEGNRQAWKASGVIEKRRWRTNADELVCPVCGPLAGTVVGLDEPFAGGIDGPPAHPRCRCWVVPAIDGARPTAEAATDSTSAFGPQGTMVSAALDTDSLVSGIREEAESVMSAIDRVHGDGDLKRIPVYTSSRMGALGRYEYYKNGVAIEIKLNPSGEHRRLTLAHEVGHFLDHQAIGIRGQYASTGRYLAGVSDELASGVQAWEHAVKGSNAYKQLRALPDSHEFLVDGRTYLFDRKYKTYLTSKEELWARSYAQFIAEESSDPAMLSELTAELADAEITGIWRQWDTADFAPIREAIRGLFIAKGWMK